MRIRLLMASLAWLLAIGMETAQATAAKAKVVYLPRNVKVIHGKSSTGGEKDYLLSKGADVDHAGWDGTFFIEEGAKLSIIYARGGRYAVFIKSRALATANESALIRVWDVANGQERHVFDTGCSTLKAVIAPNGKILAYGSEDGFLPLGDVAKGRCLHERRIDPDYPLHCLAFAPDSKMLATTMGRTILLWDVASGKPRGVLAAPPRGVSSLVFNPNGCILFSAGHAIHRGISSLEGGDDLVRAWDVTTGRELRRYPGEANRVALSVDSEWLIASGQQGQVFVWRVDSGKQALKIDNEADAAVLTPDDKLLIVLAGDVLHFWELASRQEVLAVPVPDPRNNVAALSPDGRTLASSQYGGSVILWDVCPHHLYIPEAKSRSDAEWMKLWDDLASDKAATAYRALWTLLREPSRAVTLLKAHLRPVPPRELPLNKWIADLDNDDFAKRQAAAKALREAGEPAGHALRRAREGKPSLEARKRIDQLLEEIGRQRPSSEELRSLRAIQLIEEIGSPAAHQLLEALAKGWSEARQTREAKAALARLGVKEQ